MIVEYIRYVVDTDRATTFLAAYAEAADLLQRDPHCLSYEIARGHEEPTHFVVRIEWDSLEGHLDGFRQDPAFADFFALVRPFFADIAEMSHYEARISSPALPEKGLPSLYDWCGGHPALARLINAFYDRVESDDLLGPLFPGGVGTEHREQVAAWWSEVLGGPAAYSPTGGYPRMLAHHRGLNITRPQRLRFATLMSMAADDAELPDDPEFRAAFVGYVEWGTRLALANSQDGAEVVAEAPVPRWGWGVAPPYFG
ncbi:MAG TPA: antibiotic biosynthesis monooxygenase [Propionibacteriaceae bacterium]